MRSRRGEKGRLRGAVSALAVVVLAAVTAVASPAAAQDRPTITHAVVPSFDGTPIVATLFVPAGADDGTPVPLVLRTHGWGGTGQQDAGGFVGDLLDAGYAVLTWDQRGFGCSGGEVTIDKPDVEGRDVSTLIDWAVANAPIATDASGDPRVGMTGGSYAGGIQTATAAIDDRIDVIAPEVSWSDLRYSLYSGEVVNQGWAALLYAAGLATATGLGMDPECPTFPQPGGLDPTISRGFLEGASTGTISADVLAWFAGSSLAAYGTQRPVDVPTLVIQGSTDTLFDLTDGYRIVEHVRARGAPAKFVVFCGGHVACPDSYGDADDRAHTDAAVLAWLARHLAGDTSVDTGAPVEYRTNEGVWRSTDGFPPSASRRLTATGSGSLVSVPIVALPDIEEVAGQLAEYRGGLPALPLNSGQVAPAGHPGAMTFEVASATGGPLELLGIPTVELDVRGVGTEVVLMARLVHRETGQVVDLQEGAVRVPLTGGPARVEVPMPGIAYTVPAGDHLDVQVSTESLMHGNSRVPAQVEVTARVSIPATGAGVAPPGPPAAPGGPSGSGGGSAELPATGRSSPLPLPVVLLLAGVVALHLSRRLSGSPGTPRPGRGCDPRRRSGTAGRRG